MSTPPQSAPAPAAPDPARLPRDRWLGLCAFALVVLLLAGLCVASVAILSATRAYVGGESLYTKGQKTAAGHLDLYIERGDERDYQSFEHALALPLGDQAARLALDRPAPDLAAARAGFLQGHNHPQDIDGMIWLFRLFRQVPFMADAIDIWERADAGINRLLALGGRARAVMGSSEPGPDQRLLLREELAQLNQTLDELEQAFSARLGEASRATQQILLVITSLLATLLLVTGTVFARRTWRGIDLSRQAIDDSNLRWERAAAAGRIGLLDWDLLSDEVLLDARGLAMFGLAGPAQQPLPARELQKLVLPEQRSALQQAVRQARASGGSLVLAFDIRHGNAELRRLELHAYAHGDTGSGADRVVGMLRDLTDEMQAEQLKLDKLAAERASRAKDEFLSRVSHELRTPLNAVLGFTQLVEQDRIEPPTPVQAERLRHVSRSGRQLLRLVDDLLDLSNLDRPGDTLPLRPVDLAAVVEQALALVAPLRSQPDETIAVDGPRSGLWVQAEPERLLQVLVNLLSNAIHYNRPGGRVGLSWAAADGQARVQVRDEGQGLSAEQQAQLFQPFNRLGAEYSRVAGAGLGLVISRRLVTGFGGTLNLDSVPGQGTCAQLMLPLAETPDTSADPSAAAPAKQVAHGAAPAAAALSARVLYIEDNPVNVLLMQQYVTAWPQLVLVVATTGADGLAQARQQPPDLVLLDMQLPDMTGLDVLEALRADSALNELRVIALSASAMPEQVSRAMAAGVAAYWTKPLDYSRFLIDLPQQLAAPTGSFSR